jgi:predicted lipoprotein
VLAAGQRACPAATVPSPIPEIFAGSTTQASMNPNRVLRTLPLALLLSASGTLLSGCKIERKPEADPKAANALSSGFESASFDPKAEVQALWESKALPALDSMATDYLTLQAAMQKNIDEAGAQHGYRERGESGPWNMAVRVSGTVVAAETELSAGTADIDVDNDGKADVQIQIGPVIRGTTIRDALPFISFTNYTNQIDFAQLANAFNDRAYEAALKQVDRTQLMGRKVELSGVFTADNGDELPLVTVVAFKVIAP